MPTYFPENNRPLPADNLERSLQKINDLLRSGISLDVGSGNITSDLFGRLKVSNPATLGDFTNVGVLSPAFVGASNGVGSGISHSVNESSALLVCGTVSGSYAYWESKRVFSYQSGKGLQVIQSFVLAPGATNLRQRVGYFNTTDGLYLERVYDTGSSSTKTKLVIRCSGASGEESLQADWNIDPMDGSGPSGKTIDWTKTQIMVSEFEWLGVGSALVSFIIDGQIWPVHEFKHANLFTRTYMKQATLPLRYEIQAVSGNLTAPATLKQICASVISNGGYEKRSSPTIVLSNTITMGSNNWTPFVSVRLSNLDAVILPDEVSTMVVSGTGAFEFGLFRNPTLGVTPSWNATDSPNVSYDVASTTLTNGTLFRQGFFQSTNQGSTVINQQQVYNFSNQLGRNSFTGVSDIITLAVRAHTSVASSPTLRGSLAFLDLTT